MMTKRYVGAKVRHRATFYASDGTTLADPTTVRLRIKEPERAVAIIYEYGVDPEIVKEAVGVYYYDAFYENPGRHRRRWEGEGAVEAVWEEWTDIEPSAFIYLYSMGASNLAAGSPQIQSPTLTEN